MISQLHTAYASTSSEVSTFAWLTEAVEVGRSTFIGLLKFIGTVKCSALCTWCVACSNVVYLLDDGNALWLVQH